MQIHNYIFFNIDLTKNNFFNKLKYLEMCLEGLQDHLVYSP